MAQDNNPQDLEAGFERYKRLLDQALDAMTLESVRELVVEIEAELIKIKSQC